MTDHEGRSTVPRAVPASLGHADSEPQGPARGSRGTPLADRGADYARRGTRQAIPSARSPARQASGGAIRRHQRAPCPWRVSELHHSSTGPLAACRAPPPPSGGIFGATAEARPPVVAAVKRRDRVALQPPAAVSTSDMPYTVEQSRHAAGRGRAEGGPDDGLAGRLRWLVPDGGRSSVARGTPRRWRSVWPQVGAATAPPGRRPRG